MKIFVSYARNDLEGGELERFLDDLEAELKVSLGERVEVSFRDLKDLRLGDEWKDELQGALKNSAILLAVCSPSYLKSENCGKEYSVFTERLKAEQENKKNAKYRAIFPIMWIPPRQKLPAAITRFQYANVQLPGSYSELGVRQLFRLNRYKDDALQLVTALQPH